MTDYQVDGRDAAIQEICAWLKEFSPPSQTSKSNLTFRTNKVRSTFLRGKIAEFKQKARINVQWRESLSNRLRIQPSDIVKATNTIIEMIEKELSLGGVVRLTNFGDIKTINTEEGRQIRFVADEQWARSLNEPLYQNEIGLKRKLVKKKLVRRSLDMQAPISIE